MNNNTKEAQRWFRQGKRDLQSARINEKEGIYEVACFLSQQSAEKLLKAFLYNNGERNVIGHSILKLIRRCRGYQEEFKLIESDGRNLDKLYIPTRYPNGLPELTPEEFFTIEESKAAITSAVKIAEIVEKYLQLHAE